MTVSGAVEIPDSRRIHGSDHKNRCHAQQTLFAEYVHWDLRAALYALGQVSGPSATPTVRKAFDKLCRDFADEVANPTDTSVLPPAAYMLLGDIASLLRRSGEDRQQIVESLNHLSEECSPQMEARRD